MVRPLKQGLDYFSLDVEMDDKVKLIEAKFGLLGFGIVVKLWQIIYDNSYFIKWTERELLLYKNRINADINIINDVINECIKWDLFDKNLHEKYSILTSKGIQKRFNEATKRRKDLIICPEYWLIGVPKEATILHSEKEEELVNADINSINDSNSTQRKVKERKGKEIICADALVVQVIDYLNEKAGKAFKPETKTFVCFINARKGEGAVLEDFEAVIDYKVKKWKGTEQEEYLRPSTLFAPSHFSEYLTEARANMPQPEKPKPEQKEDPRKANWTYEEAEERISRAGSLLSQLRTGARNGKERT